MYSILDFQKKHKPDIFSGTHQSLILRTSTSHLTTLTNDFPSLCVTGVTLQRPYLEQSYY